MTNENKTNYALIFTICFYFSAYKKTSKKNDYMTKGQKQHEYLHSH